MPKKNIKIPQQQKAPLRTQSIPEKVQKLEKNIERLQENALKPELQELLIQEIKGIKSELKEIKYHIGMNGASEPPRRSVQGEEE